MHNGYVAALQLQATRCFQAEQTAPDHDRAHTLARTGHQRSRVVRLRKVNTFALSTPSMGGMSGREPVASSSLS